MFAVGVPVTLLRYEVQVDDGHHEVHHVYTIKLNKTLDFGRLVSIRCLHYNMKMRANKLTLCKEFHLQIQISPDTPIDLQMHTTYSDGRWSAEQLFDYLAQEGFGLVAVTDHDRVDTVASIQQVGMQKHVPVLPAVEISAEWHGKMADVLCFGFDPHEKALRAIADHVRQSQKDNAEKVYEELLRRGYQFPHRKEHLTATVGELRVAGDCGILLIKHGYVKDWSSALEMIRDAGYREMKADMAKTVEAVHRSRGVALIAHPGRGKLEPQEFTYYTPDLLDQVRAEISLERHRGLLSLTRTGDD